MTSRSKQSGQRDFLKFAGLAAAGGPLAGAALARGAQGLTSPARGLPKLKITDVRVIVTCPGLVILECEGLPPVCIRPIACGEDRPLSRLAGKRCQVTALQRPPPQGRQRAGLVGEPVW